MFYKMSDLTCRTCTRSFNTPRAYKCHMNVIHGVRDQTKCLCGKEYKNARDYVNHKNKCLYVVTKPFEPAQQSQVVYNQNTYITNHITNTDNSTNNTNNNNTQNNMQVNIASEFQLVPMTDEIIEQNIMQFIDNLIVRDLDINSYDTFSAYWHQSKFKNTIMTRDSGRGIGTWFDGQQTINDKDGWQYIQKVSDIIQRSPEIREKLNVYVHNKKEQSIGVIGTNDAFPTKTASVQIAQFYNDAKVAHQAGKSIVKIAPHIKTTKLTLTDTCKLKWLSHQIRRAIHVKPAELLLVSSTSMGLCLKHILLQKDSNLEYNHNTQTFHIVCDDGVRQSFHSSMFVQILKHELISKMSLIDETVLYLLEDEHYVHSVIRADCRSNSYSLAKYHWLQLEQYIKGILLNDEAQQFESQILMGLTM